MTNERVWLAPIKGELRRLEKAGDLGDAYLSKLAQLVVWNPEFARTVDVELKVHRAITAQLVRAALDRLREQDRNADDDRGTPAGGVAPPDGGGGGGSGVEHVRTPVCD